MNIEYINNWLTTEINYRDRNDQDVAENHKDSLFYRKDVESNKSLFESINTSLIELKDSISNIQTKINTEWESSFYNTYDKLAFQQKRIPDNITSDTETKILIASETAFNTYKEKYKNNLASINSKINTVQNSINGYRHALSAFNGIKEKLKNNTLSEEEIDSLKRQKKMYESNMGTYRETCETLLTKIHNLNNENLNELLSKGLSNKI